MRFHRSYNSMEQVEKGIYTYLDAWDSIDASALPSELVLSDRISNEAVLIRLLCGTLKIKYELDGNEEIVDQCENYSVPGIENNSKFQKKIVKDFFSFDHYRQEDRKCINKYITLNRKNHFIHQQVLCELTAAMIWKEKSPIESFVHIYRALEFMSYSFPLIYASKSMDFRGSYEKLKKFIGGDSASELNFFKLFLKEMFENTFIYEYEFEVYFLDGNEALIKTELDRITKSQYYTFDGNTMKIKFANVADFLITVRNRYFHMLVGKGTENFYETRYDKRDLFRAVNPIFINWLSLIYKEIASYSIGVI